MDDASLQTSEESAVSVGLNGGINREGQETVLSVDRLLTVFCTLIIKGNHDNTPVLFNYCLQMTIEASFSILTRLKFEVKLTISLANKSILGVKF